MSSSTVISRGGQTDYLVGLKDLFAGFSRTELWLAFAYDEIQQRYRRSKLGLAWIVMSYMLFVGAISVFFGGFSEKGLTEFTAFVSMNFAIYSFLTAQLSDGCAVFKSNKTWIASIPLPHSVHVFKSVSRSVFVFLINLLVGMAALLAIGGLRDPIAFLAIPAFLVLLVNGVLLQATFGYITVRFRDFEHLIQSITRILFFITPILWVRAEQPEGTLRRMIADLNPLTHGLEIFSAPLLGRMPDPVSWPVIAILTGVNLVVMVVVAFISHRRMPYWL